jgi:hypothetical protein
MRWKRTRRWANTLPVFSKRAICSLEVMNFRTESTFAKLVKYPVLTMVARAAGHLTHPRIGPSLPFRLQDRQVGLGHPHARDKRRHHSGHCSPDLSAAFLDKEHVFTAGEAILRAANLVARPLTPPPGGVRSAIRRIAESFRGCTN